MILLTVISAVGNSPRSQETPKQPAKQLSVSAIIDSSKTRDDSIMAIKKQIDESYLKSKGNIAIIQKEIRSSQLKEKDIDKMIRLVQFNQTRIDVAVRPIPLKKQEPEFTPVQITIDTVKTKSSKGFFRWLRIRD